MEIKIIEGRILDDIKIPKIRHLLEEHQNADQILEGNDQNLSEKI